MDSISKYTVGFNDKQKQVFEVLTYPIVSSKSVNEIELFRNGSKK